ncbi:unnamed protein product, partial [Discosporangium mesarthrocarpum]
GGNLKRADLSDWEVGQEVKRHGSRLVIELKDRSSGSSFLLGATDLSLMREWLFDIQYVKWRTSIAKWTRVFRSSVGPNPSLPPAGLATLPDRDWHAEWLQVCRPAPVARCGPLCPLSPGAPSPGPGAGRSGGGGSRAGGTVAPGQGKGQ